MKKKRLWDKGAELDAQVHAFTVGQDPNYDLTLVPWDLVASAAHARMLESIDILTQKECSSLLQGLKEIFEQSNQGQFQIESHEEDCHTAIENALLEKLGEAAYKLHTGRSRNDQVLVASRLLLRHEVLNLVESLEDIVSSLLKRFDELGELPMPGYTHLRRAMPSSVGIWLHGFVENFLELAQLGINSVEQLNKNPLGVASGFGVPLPLDRDLTAKLLGFSSVQRSFVDVQNSRGRYELRILNWLTEIASAIEKCACDFLLYSTEEFGFFNIPEAFTTGSSIMPQKRNPDVLELLRASASSIRAAQFELSSVTAKLPSHYHRDFQLSKPPLLSSLPKVHQTITILDSVLRGFSVNNQKLEAAFSPEIYSTYYAYHLVKNGTPFRLAYREAAEKDPTNLDVEALKADFADIQKGVAKEVKQASSELVELSKKRKTLQQSFARVEKSVFNLS